MITKSFINGVTPEQVVTEMLAFFASMPMEAQQKAVRAVIAHDPSLILESLLPNLLAGLTKEERESALRYTEMYHHIKV